MRSIEITNPELLELLEKKDSFYEENIKATVEKWQDVEKEKADLNKKVEAFDADLKVVKPEMDILNAEVIQKAWDVHSVDLTDVEDMGELKKEEDKWVLTVNDAVAETVDALAKKKEGFSQVIAENLEMLKKAQEESKETE